MSGNRRFWFAAVFGLLAAALGAVLLLSLGQLTPARADDTAAALGKRLATLSPSSPWLKPDTAKPLSRIGFGSCLDQKKPQPIWSDVIKDKPDLFLMLGDNIYVEAKPPDLDEMFEAYAQQAAHPEFAAARAAMPFLAMWDDNDYGRNDGGASYAGKRLSAAAFHAFWQMDRESARADAIYYSRMLGPPGRTVQVIMLDARFDRSDLTPKPADQQAWGRYGPDSDPSKAMLGTEQWAWLEQELKRPADLRFIVSGVQVLADGHAWERWGNFPLERERLLRLIASTAAKGVVLLSGDRHSAAVYRHTGTPYPLVEITGSSLNRPYGPNKDTRMPPLISDIYSAENYGLADIDWAAGRIDVSIKAIGGDVVMRHTIAFTDLGLAR